MPTLSRRTFMVGGAAGASCYLAGCATTPVQSVHSAPAPAPDPAFRRQVVDYSTQEAFGTIIIDPATHYLYYSQAGDTAIRYGIAVGREGYGWSGTATVRSKQEWPDWYPTEEYLEEHPKVRPALRQLQSGMGIPGGPQNPLGARALYLWQGNRDTLYRIHGTNEPWAIGTNVSSGCIRMVDEDIIDLYDRTAIGAKVVVLPVGLS